MNTCEIHVELFIKIHDEHFLKLFEHFSGLYYFIKIGKILKILWTFSHKNIICIVLIMREQPLEFHEHIPEMRKYFFCFALIFY